MGSLEHRLALSRAGRVLPKKPFDIGVGSLHRRERLDDSVDFGDQRPSLLRKPVGSFDLLLEQHRGALPMRRDNGFGTFGGGPAKSFLQGTEQEISGNVADQQQDYQ